MEDFTNRCNPTFCAHESFTHEQILALIDQICILHTSTMFMETLEHDFPLLTNTVNSIAKYAQMSVEILLERNLDFFTEQVAEKIRDLAHPHILAQILVQYGGFLF